MNATVFAFTLRGKATARRVAEALGGGCELLAPPRLAGEGFDGYAGSLSDCTGKRFESDALVFVGAAGIAVRAIAPHVEDKASDPAVLCVDEAARFVIPLLSGHIGGANALARRLSEALGATAVVTTATDVNGRFSVDAWAAERGYIIASMALAKRVSAEILVRDVPFCCDGPRPDALPDGLIWSEQGALGVCVSVRDRHPFGETLLLIPRALRLGLGCRRGTPQNAVAAAIEAVLSENGLRPEAVCEAATIDVKADEPGLVDCCLERGWPLRLYPAQALRAVPGDFAASAFVERSVGVDNVCERAAAASGGRLIVPKTARDGVTVAVAELEWGVDFG